MQLIERFGSASPLSLSSDDEGHNSGLGSTARTNGAALVVRSGHGAGPSDSGTTPGLPMAQGPDSTAPPAVAAQMQIEQLQNDLHLMRWSNQASAGVGDELHERLPIGP